MSNGIAQVMLELPNESIKKSIEKVVRDHGFVEHQITLSEGSKKGDNYVGIVYRIHITGKKKNGETGTFNLFCKIPPSSVARRKQFRATDVFGREALIYNVIIPEFQKFTKKKGIHEGGFDAYPKCYEANTDDGEEYLLMEDLRDGGYTMFNRLLEVDFHHAKLLMEELGKFHALSFAMKDQDIVTYKKLSNISEIFWQSLDQSLRTLMKTNIIKAIDTLEETDVRCIELLNKFDERYEESLRYCMDDKNAEPYAVIGHGDCWNNNFLFKYKDGFPVKICLLDWQIARHASPVLDLLYFIFCCTEKPLRDEHYDDLLRVYHGSLSKFLTRLGSDPEKLFPYSALQDQLKKFGVFGLCTAAMLVPIIVRQSEDFLNLDDITKQMQDNPEAKIEYSVFNEKTEITYKKRIRDVIRDIVRLGYI